MSTDELLRVVRNAVAALDIGEADEARRALAALLKPDYPRCEECGDRFPTAQLREGHRCHGLYNARRSAA